ncbi:WG repeat-containing protein [Cupriavidus basilensis]|uniref:WG repeat-containing protein n=1 Tax=Cupriavidus basilensis TaxID=68895 RepID=A0ABT6B1K7_9BURK|nr:WG repeat-containing protein [Cupriavidus basilensis]MDF3838777.1 WG repeat-containing protein [Cupriavidus basilensis]
MFCLSGAILRRYPIRLLHGFCLSALCLVGAVPGTAAPVGTDPAQSCNYFDRKGDWRIYRDCVRPDATGLHLAKGHLRRLDFDKRGVASLLANGQYYYVDRSGASLAVISHDNWADDFAEGLVRARVDGKIGYFGPDFRQAIATTYDWGWPFRNGIARVCNGCYRGVTDSHGHTPMTGGRWFHIDRKGNEVAEPE